MNKEYMSYTKSEMNEMLIRKDTLIEEIKPKKEPMGFTKKIVLLVIFLNITFTAAVFYAFITVQSEPQALIAAFFAFTTGELWLMASIKKKEIVEDDCDELD